MNDNRDVHDEPQSKVRKLDSSCSNAQCTDGVGQAEAVPIPEEIMISPVGEVPFNNGQWLPVCPEPASELYWWQFPWTQNTHNDNFIGEMNNGNHSAIWKFVAGSLITHLPEYCIHAMTTYLAHEVLHHRRLVPQVVDFGPEYESVLEYFTASMLGIPEDVPQQKYGLLTKLLESTGFNTIASLEEQQHRSKLDVSLRVQEVPFGNGQWIPIIPEPEEHVYWWYFPWRYRRRKERYMRVPNYHATWKLVAGNSITHLPTECLSKMTPKLESKFIYPKCVAPKIIHFSPEYETVLHYFTERMLGIDDFIPLEKRGLLNKLFDESGFLRDLPLHDRFGTKVPEKYPI